MDVRISAGVSALAAVAVGVGAWLAVGPAAPVLASDVTSGDAALAQRLTQALGPDAGQGSVVVAWVEDGRVTTAGVGTRDGSAGGDPVTAGTPFEIGSVTKGLTGMLLADAVERGEVTLDQSIGDSGTASQLDSTGSATLEELATHRSGLPRLAPGLGTLAGGVALNVTGRDPYSGTPDDVFEAAGAAGAPGGAEPAYSNLGYAVLGQVLARTADTTYPGLLSERVTGPLGMDATVVALTDDDVPAGAAHGVMANGLAAEPWTAEGYVPAGIGTWSTAEDMGLLVAALLDGTAPGVVALDPLADDGDGRSTGMAWITDAADPAAGTPEVTWHNGQTGGFHSFVGLDRAAGRGVVVLATGASVDAVAVDLLLAAATGDR